MSRTYNTEPYLIQKFHKNGIKPPKSWKDYERGKWDELPNAVHENGWEMVSTKERGKTELRRQLNREYRNRNRQRLREGNYETLRHRKCVDWLWY